MVTGLFENKLFRELCRFIDLASRESAIRKGVAQWEIEECENRSITGLSEFAMNLDSAEYSGHE